jgi:hypothetical protein
MLMVFWRRCVLRPSTPWQSAGDVGSLTTTLQGFGDPHYDAERGTREALADQSIRDINEEIQAHALEAAPTLIHTQQTKDRFWRGFAVPIEPWGW